MEQKNKYTAKELALILDIKKETIDFYDKNFAVPGKTGMGILFHYSLDSGRFILEKEMQAKKKKKAKTIEKKGSKIIVNKKSLESLIKTAKITGAPISAKVENPQYYGSDYAGTKKYHAQPHPNLEFCFEQIYRIDKRNEVTEVIQNTKDELAEITNKHGILTSYA